MDFDITTALDGRILTCDDCGTRCKLLCGTRRFRLCCVQYVKKKRTVDVVNDAVDIPEQPHHISVFERRRQLRCKDDMEDSPYLNSY